MNTNLSYRAANERTADLRRSAADHRRAQSVLMNKAASEQRAPEPIGTRLPLLRRIIRTA